MPKIEQEVSDMLQTHSEDILSAWQNQLIANAKNIVEMIGLSQLRQISGEILTVMINALPSGVDTAHFSYEKARQVLAEISREMTTKNLTPSETAVFIYSLKDAVFPILQKAIRSEKKLTASVLTANTVIDKLGIYTFEVYLASREELIREQQRLFMESSVPVVKVWNDILLIPLVGMLDSSRTQLMMETMLKTLEETQSKVAILDISGIPIVDTLVARHLITAATAARLMGAECLITGIRARISQTLVQIGVDLSGFTTRATLADGLKLALKLTNQSI